MKNVNDLMNGPVRMYLIERGASDSIEFGGEYTHKTLFLNHLYWALE